MKRPVVALVGDAPDWQDELGALLEAAGFAASRTKRLEGAFTLLDGGAVEAVFLSAGPLNATDLLLLRRIREVSSRTAVVVVTRTPTDPDIKRALESGATAFLSWPASAAAVKHAIDRGSRLASSSSPPATPGRSAP